MAGAHPSTYHLALMARRSSHSFEPLAVGWARTRRRRWARRLGAPLGHGGRVRLSAAILGAIALVTTFLWNVEPREWLSGRSAFALVVLVSVGALWVGLAVLAIARWRRARSARAAILEALAASPSTTLDALVDARVARGPQATRAADGAEVAESRNARLARVREETRAALRALVGSGLVDERLEPETMLVHYERVPPTEAPRRPPRRAARALDRDVASGEGRAAHADGAAEPPMPPPFAALALPKSVRPSHGWAEAIYTYVVWGAIVSVLLTLGSGYAPPAYVGAVELVGALTLVAVAGIGLAVYVARSEAAHRAEVLTSTPQAERERLWPLFVLEHVDGDRRMSRADWTRAAPVGSEDELDRALDAALRDGLLEQGRPRPNREVEDYRRAAIEEARGETWSVRGPRAGAAPDLSLEAPLAARIERTRALLEAYRARLTVPERAVANLGTHLWGTLFWPTTLALFVMALGVRLEPLAAPLERGVYEFALTLMVVLTAFGGCALYAFLPLVTVHLESSATRTRWRYTDASRVAALLHGRASRGFATLQLLTGLTELELVDALEEAIARGFVEEVLERGRLPRYRSRVASREGP